MILIKYKLLQLAMNGPILNVNALDIVPSRQLHFQS